MRKNEIGYWSCAALTCAFAALPFVPERSMYVIPDIIIFVYPALWISFFWLFVRFAKRTGRRWAWLLLSAPFALRYITEGLVMLVFWVFHGFAP